MSYEEIKKKYSQAASKQSDKVKLAQIKVERMQAAYDIAYEDWQEASRIANTHICKETAEDLREAAAAMRRSKERLIKAKHEFDTINAPEATNIAEHYANH